MRSYSEAKLKISMETTSRHLSDLDLLEVKYCPTRGLNVCTPFCRIPYCDKKPTHLVRKQDSDPNPMRCHVPEGGSLEHQYHKDVCLVFHLEKHSLKSDSTIL
ncbi:hypothetical protein HNY73_009316 [Argiope bruennichi]|uniref:Uncharacterized protein n=1 Tax=Argiope bruennichi TaxID=94029 RepID=A0A8T0FEA8_ARGBR|nr:hypothetical protein HNY73_009316 [Argiope bruennichi]